MMRALMVAGMVAGIVAGTLGFAPQTLAQDGSAVPFPEGFRERLRLYAVIDKPDRKIVRFLYVGLPRGATVPREGCQLPEGAMLIREERRAVLGADGQPMRDPAGRYITQPDPFAISVRVKRAGAGEQFPPRLRTGDWDYAIFHGDGSRRQFNTTQCVACHVPLGARVDYTQSCAALGEALRDARPARPPARYDSPG